MHCHGPKCRKTVEPGGPDEFFCCRTCWVAWKVEHLDYADSEQDQGRGYVKGADYSPGMSHRNRGSNLTGHAFPWLDIRTEET